MKLALQYVPVNLTLDSIYIIIKTNKFLIASYNYVV